MSAQERALAWLKEQEAKKGQQASSKKDSASHIHKNIANMDVENDDEEVLDVPVKKDKMLVYDTDDEPLDVNITPEQWNDPNFDIPPHIEEKILSKAVGRGKAKSYEEIHNDTGNSVKVWFKNSPLGMAVQSSELAAGATWGPWKFWQGLAHYACVQYLDPITLGDKSKCKENFIGLNGGETARHMVSDIIKTGQSLHAKFLGPEDFTTQSPAVSTNQQISWSAVELLGEHVEHFSLDAFALVLFMVALICYAKRCSLRKAASGLKESLLNT